MLSVIARGWLHTAAIETVLLQATLSLFAFAAIGYVLGWIANRTVEDSVQAAISAHLENESEPTAVQ